jgi:hypothetical protein
VDTRLTRLHWQFLVSRFGLEWGRQFGGVQQSEVVGGAGEGDVAVRPTSGSGADVGGFDEDDVIELKPLRLPGRQGSGRVWDLEARQSGRMAWSAITAVLRSSSIADSIAATALGSWSASTGQYSGGLPGRTDSGLGNFGSMWASTRSARSMIRAGVR